MKIPIKKVLIGILMLCFFPSLLQGQSPSLPLEHPITLVFSSNVHGEFEPCG